MIQLSNCARSTKASYQAWTMTSQFDSSTVSSLLWSDSERLACHYCQLTLMTSTLKAHGVLLGLISPSYPTLTMTGECLYLQQKRIYVVFLSAKLSTLMGHLKAAPNRTRNLSRFMIITLAVFFRLLCACALVKRPVTTDSSCNTYRQESGSSRDAVFHLALQSAILKLPSLVCYVPNFLELQFEVATSIFAKRCGERFKTLALQMHTNNLNDYRNACGKLWHWGTFHYP